MCNDKCDVGDPYLYLFLDLLAKLKLLLFCSVRSLHGVRCGIELSHTFAKPLSGKPILNVTKNDICTNEQLDILKSLKEVTIGKPPYQVSFLVSPQVVRTPKQQAELYHLN